ncbi:DNA-binding transcriptional ArsR family regulator [Modestobacter versicolor]|uniref:DNA-binding transcriptional ArsR family regulator n=2 Tax=Modestobacter versicolor TaxID=429133 RepID=A0A839XYI9_9ACTN|nr:DNA-binding transcriptional ArsR family regulator [Modestobacter versicolor]
MPVSAESIARFAAVLADRSRVEVCLALMDGRAWTAAELARHVGIARSTASEHLTALVRAGLLVERRQGRARYLQLAGPEAAAVIEELGAAVGERVRPSSLRAARADSLLTGARTCYDHLAGRWGVSLYDALVSSGLLSVDGGLALTPAGRRWSAEVGAVGVPAGRRPLLRECLDWTERRSHLGGQLGAALLRHALAAGWVEPVAAHPRALRVTPVGERLLADPARLGG